MSNKLLLACAREHTAHSLLKGIEVGPNQGRSGAAIGERGLDKSHVMAMPYYAMNRIEGCCLRTCSAEEQ